MMFLIHWFLALVTLLTIPLIIFINLMITKKIPSLFVKQQKALTTLNSFCEEIISGVKIISVFKMQDKFGRSKTKNGALLRRLIANC